MTHACALEWPDSVFAGYQRACSSAVMVSDADPDTAEDGNARAGSPHGNAGPGDANSYKSGFVSYADFEGDSAPAPKFGAHPDHDRDAALGSSCPAMGTPQNVGNRDERLAEQAGVLNRAGGPVRDQSREVQMTKTLGELARLCTHIDEPDPMDAIFPHGGR